MGEVCASGLVGRSLLVAWFADSVVFGRGTVFDAPPESASARLAARFLAKSACALSSSSPSMTFDNLLACNEVLGGGWSALELRFPFAGGGEVNRVVVEPRLDAGRLGEAGDGARKVRSVMELLLSVLRTPGRPFTLPITLVLPCDEFEFRLIMRFVCMLPTGSGVEV